MLQHNNPFRRFLLSLSALKRFNRALTALEEKAHIQPNLVMFSLWVAQQELQLSENWQDTFKAYFNWQQDFGGHFAQQLSKLKHLAQVSEVDDNGPLHRIISHLNQAKKFASQQEQALLFFYYQQRQSLEKATSRQEALIHNLQQTLPEATPLAVQDLTVLLSIVVEDDEISDYLEQLTADGKLVLEDEAAEAEIKDAKEAEETPET